MTSPKLNKKFNLVFSSSAPWGDIPMQENTSWLANLAGRRSGSSWGASPFAASTVDMLRLGMNAAFVNSREAGEYQAKFRWGVPEDIIRRLGLVFKTPIRNSIDFCSFNTGEGGFVDHPIHAPHHIVFDFEHQGNQLNPPLWGDTPPFGTPILTHNAAGAAAGVFYRGIVNTLETTQDFFITPSFPSTHQVNTGAGNGDQERYPGVVPLWMTNKNEWLQFVGDNFNSKTYYDFSLNMEWPYPLKETEQSDNASLRPNFVSIEPSYNFYVKEYEEALIDSESRDMPIASWQLPNLYTFASEMNENIRDPSISGDPGSIYNYQITMDGNIHGVFEDITKIVGGKEVKTGEKDTGQYFQKYGNLFRDQTMNSRVVASLQPHAFGNAAQNLMFTKDNLNLLNNKEGMEKQFPMSVAIEFSTDQNTGFADLLDSANLTSVLMGFTASGSAESGLGHSFEEDYLSSFQFSFPDWVQPTLIGTTSRPGTANQATPRREALESEYRNLRVFNLAAWIDSLMTVGSTRDVGEQQISAAETKSFLDDWTHFIEENSKAPKDSHQLWLGNFIRTLESTTEVMASAADTGTAHMHTDDYALYFKLMTLIFTRSAIQFIEEKFRSFENLLRNDLPGFQDGRKDAYSETLFYCIEKTSGMLDGDGAWTAPETSTTQYVWLPNSSDIDVLKYIDTQVKYDVPYRYRILAYQMVIGNQYTYTWNANALKTTRPQSAPSGDAPADAYGNAQQTTAVTDTENLWAKLCVKNKPCIKLIEIPIYNSLWDNPQGIRVLDSPPVPPDVHLIPYRGVSDKILIWFKSNVGDFRAEPIELRPGDYDDDINFNNKIRFKSDDPVKDFEIFKLDKRPVKYSDFREASYGFIGETDDGVPDTSFVDTIKPNKKYYYTFRSRDVHGRISNPTPVYECEMVKQEKFTFPIIRVIDMTQPQNLAISKPFRKFLQINVSPSHTQLNALNLDDLASQYAQPTLPPNWFDENVAAQNAIRFIPQPHTVWDSSADKKWKVRLHSKNSGKKIDFNIDFNSSPSVIDDREE